MPKYLTRQEFETMKVLRNRKYTIQEIAQKMFLAPATVSRNLKYRSYDDYYLSMHAKSAKGGSKVQSNSGECRTVGKTCHKCGKAKMLSEFDKRKKSRDGHSTVCKECRKAYQREWEHKKKAAREKQEVVEKAPEHEDIFPDDFLFKFFSAHGIEEEPIQEDGCKWLYNIGDRGFINGGNGYHDCVITALVTDDEKAPFYVVHMELRKKFRKIKADAVVHEHQFYKLVKEK